MDSLIFVAFITGLTAGGLSCFAVQGGLISGSIAHKVEAAFKGNRATAARSAEKAERGGGRARQQKEIGQDLVLFLIAKLVAYTLVGFLLGAIGSVFTPSPVLKGVIQVGIGVFLVGNALRMFDIHPIFRYFSFEPPSGVTRWIRRYAKRDEGFVTPLFLGALTVLIPCGITQSMMAVAIGTGNPWLGAVIMFAFTLGTSPTFLVVTWVATSLGGFFQKSFYRVVAVLVLLLGLYTVDTGLVVMGSPVSAMGLVQSLGTPQAAPAAVAPGERVEIQVGNSGYSPEQISLPAGQPVDLHLVTAGTYSCARAFVIPALRIEQILPEAGDTLIQIPAQAPGTVLQFTCSMGMFGGRLIFE